MPALVVESGPQPNAVERLLRALPEWFGIESAIIDYVADATRLPTLVALDPDCGVIGILLYARHFPETAEIHLMAVDRERRGSGVGHDLIGALEAKLSTDGVGLLTVKTLGPSHPDIGYGQTRAFYRSCGFVPVEEFPELWPGNPCLLMAKPLGAGGRSSGRR